MSTPKPLTIHVYNNSEKHRQRMAEIMAKHEVKAGPLIEAIIENFTDAEWEKYAKLAKESRAKSENTSAVVLAKAIRGMSNDDVEKLLAGMQKMGIDLNTETANGN